ncbi:MAG: hypothetical protein JWM81_1079 [Candidatus Saccharibacteria bacterium]|nr:hypothetical protein [Candidatus Saccharibacteria bacterium]
MSRSAAVVLLRSKSLLQLAKQRWFRVAFVSLSLFVLLIVTLLSGYYGGRLQLGNADQLVNPYLFENATVARHALYPGPHTFLLKWPFFLIVKLFGFTDTNYIAVTMLVLLATIAGLTYVIWRIERRPLVFGAICLALASILIAIPGQPHAGGLLPVNMAMIATRNIEYVVLIGAVALVVSAKAIRSWKFLAGTLLLTILVASDQLFLSISIAGAVGALIAYGVRKKINYVALSGRFILASGGAAIMGLALILTIKNTGLIGITMASSPYGFVGSAHSLLLAAIYGASGILTNFGANPAYDATIVANIPGTAIRHMLSLGGPTYIVNACLFIVALALASIQLWSSLRRQKIRKQNISHSDGLSLLLLWTSGAAVGLFIISNHYYAVDARYLTITLFALSITAVSRLRGVRISADKLLIISAMLLTSVVLGALHAGSTYRVQAAALSDIKSRNMTVIQTLKARNVDVLLGDYWRVLPIRQHAGQSMTVTPLQNCTQPRQVLTSHAWQTDTKNKPFAYLLSFDKSLTDFPKCTLEQVIAYYGRPNESTLIAGTLKSPKEVLLYYDQGKNTHRAPTVRNTATVLPISIQELPNMMCRGESVMNIVAHEDDDLLFLNPTIIEDIASKHCVHTIYVTAGDGGHGAAYLSSRELGAQAAYAQMYGASNIWTQRIVQIAEGEYVRIASLSGHHDVSLIFLRLPDGGLDGNGFAGHNYESLRKLASGRISTIHSLDGQSHYSSQGLKAALSTLMSVYNPSEIRTQSSQQGLVYRDHSDHHAVGAFATQAYDLYEHDHYDGLVAVGLRYYMGYPIRESRPNLDGSVAKAKLAAFLAYAKYDIAVCKSESDCGNSATYGSYLTRQYLSP